MVYTQQIASEKAQAFKRQEGLCKEKAASVTGMLGA